MKKNVITICSMLAFAAFLNSTNADAKGGKGWKMLINADKNGDKEVTLEEFKSHYNETKPKMKEIAKERRAKRFEMLDTDKNGSISKEEFISRVKDNISAEEIFAELDSDSNQKITQDDIMERRKGKGDKPWWKFWGGKKGKGKGNNK